MENLKNDSFFLLRKIEEIEEIVKTFILEKKVTSEKMNLLDKKIFVVKVALKNQIFNKNN